jgi:hypothetical protein
VQNTNTSGLIVRLEMVRASGRSLATKETMPSLEIEAGQGARSMVRPRVSGMGTLMKKARMRERREYLR